MLHRHTDDRSISTAFPLQRTGKSWIAGRKKKENKEKKYQAKQKAEQEK